MNEKNYNEDIEILDGLEDFFDYTPEVKEEKVEAKEPELEEEEVLSVLDEAKESTPFTEFTPTSLEEEPVVQVAPLMDEIESENEKVESSEEVQEIPTMDETMEAINPMQDTVTIEPLPSDEVFHLSEEPVVSSVSDEMVSNEMNVQEHEMEEPFPKEGIEIGPSSLEPVEIDSWSAENQVEEPSFTDVTPTMEEANIETDSMAPDLDLNYNFAHDFSNGEYQTIDDAFQFEPTMETIEEPKEDIPLADDSMEPLGKTVIIEPVNPKDIEEPANESSEQQVPSNLPVVEETQVVPVEEKEEKKSKDKKEKKNSRTVLFVILLIILLLAFAALVPIALEKFAV